MQTAAEQFAARIAQDQQAFESVDLGGFLHDTARPLVLQNVRDNFTSSVSPDGVEWAERKFIGDGHPLLIEFGPLMQAATGGGPGHISQVQSREMSLGVDASIEYAAIHNFGGVTRPMPQREFMGASESTEDLIEEKLADYVLGSVFGVGAGA